MYILSKRDSTSDCYPGKVEFGEFDAKFLVLNSRLLFPKLCFMF